MVSRIKKFIFFKCFEDMLKSGAALVQTPVFNMLDTGCGTGRETLKFMDLFKLKTAYGIDLFKATLYKCDNRIKRINCDMNFQIPIKDGQFDFIMSNHAIEHVINVRNYLSECRRLLKDGGQILIMTDNLCSPINIGCLLFGWQPIALTNINGWNIGNPFMKIDEDKDVYANDYDICLTKNHTGILGHIYVFTPSGIKDLLKRCGFRDIKIITPNIAHFLIAYGRK